MWDVYYISTCKKKHDLFNEKEGENILKEIAGINVPGNSCAAS